MHYHRVVEQDRQIDVEESGASAGTSSYLRTRSQHCGAVDSKTAQDDESNGQEHQSGQAHGDSYLCVVVEIDKGKKDGGEPIEAQDKDERVSSR